MLIVHGAHKPLIRFQKPKIFVITRSSRVFMNVVRSSHPFFLTSHRLWLVETGTDAKLFDLLGACIGLKTLSLSKNLALRADLDEQILQQLRDVTVEFS